MAQPIRRGDNDGLVSERARLQMGEKRRAQGVRAPAVLRAMSTVPRHIFVEHGLASRAYEDVALPIGHGQTISKPSTVARMIQLIVDQFDEGRLKTLKVLEIGTGCGYQAAVLSHVFADVVSIERVRWLHELAKTHIRPFRLPNLRLVFGDGSIGVAAGAPYDGMISAAAAEGIAEAWCRQLQVGGRLVAPVKSATSDAQSLHVVDRLAEEDWSLTVLDSVRFVPLRAGTSR